MDFPTFTADIDPSVRATGFSPEGVMPFHRPADLGILQKAPNLRVPFEAIVDQQTFYPKTPQKFLENLAIDGVDPDKTETLSETLKNAIQFVNVGVMQTIADADNDAYKMYSMWGGESLPMFEMATHNFVSEVPTFFLAGNGALTTFASKPESEFKPMRSGSHYLMDVVLYKSEDLVTTEGPRKTLLNFGNIAVFNGPQRGAVYGPALGSNMDSPLHQEHAGIQSGSAGGGTTIPWKAYSDPAYACWAPPYFYGRSIARIKFSPHQHRHMDENTSAKFTLEEIFAGADVKYFNMHPMALSGAFKTEAGSEHFHLENNWMQNSASLNMFQISQNPQISIDPVTGEKRELTRTGADNKVWTISTKWECPVLDFHLGGPNNQDPNLNKRTFYNVEDKALVSLGSGEHYSTYSTAGASGSTGWTLDSGSCRALWNTYGAIPKGKKGLFLTVEESAYNHENVFIEHNPGRFRGAAMDLQPGQTGSLAQVCGFTNTKEKIGQIASQREISELVVAVPYLHRPTKEQKKSKKVWYNNDYGRYFFRINGLSFALQQLHKEQTGNALPENMIFDGAPAVKDTSLTDLAEKMKKYVFPPNMDFLQNPSKIKPFVMYTFEFNSILDQEDLSDIWQGVMPKPSLKAEKEEVTITHTNSAWEFFNGKGVPTNVKWMVFKVKKRAKTNYYDLVDDAQAGDKFKFKFDLSSAERKAPNYSYNWPYDFFSLVELAQLESEIVIDAKKNE